MVLGNLLENAIYAAAKANRSDKLVSLFLEGNEDRIEIQVADNGVGMTPEVRDRIFEY